MRNFSTRIASKSENDALKRCLVRAAMAVPNVVIGPGRALDAYSIKARWAPVFLVVLPPLILCFSLVPGLPAWNKLWPLLATTPRRFGSG